MHHCAIVPLRHRAIVPLRDRVLSACSIRPDVARGLIRWDELCALREFGLRAHGGVEPSPWGGGRHRGSAYQIPGNASEISVPRAPQAGIRPASGLHARSSGNAACIGIPRVPKLEYGLHWVSACAQAGIRSTSGLRVPSSVKSDSALHLFDILRRSEARMRRR